MTYRRGERCRCVDVLFVGIVVFAPTALWAAALRPNVGGFGAATIAGQLAGTNRGLIDGPRANVTLAGLDAAATDGASMRAGRFAAPRRTAGFGAMGLGTGGLSSATPDIGRGARHAPPRAGAAASVAVTRYVAPNTGRQPSGNTVDMPASGLADCHRA